MFRSVFTISFYISLSRILGFIRDIFIAKYLGVSVLSDAFFAAFRLPNSFRRIFAEGAMNSAFVPIFIDKMHDSEKGKHENGHILFVRNIFSLLLYTILLLILLMQIFMPFMMKIIFPGFVADVEKFSLLVSLSRITIFYLLFISLVAICSGALNSVNKFAVPAAAPIILNSVLIFSIFVFGPMVPNYAYALSWGVFAAGVLQFLWLLIFTLKAGILVYPRLSLFDKDSKKDITKFFRKMLPGIIGSNVMQINLLVDSIFASMFAGAISYLYYADRINQLPLAMIGIAIGIALLPNLTKKIKSGEGDAAINMHNTALEVGLILVLPAALALTCISHPIIITLFERGAFTQEQGVFVAKALQFYSFGLPSYVLVKIMEPAFFSRGDTKTPMRIAIVCMVANIVFNAIFFQPFGYLGVIMASIMSSYINLTLLITQAIKRKYFYFKKDFVKKLLSIVVPSVTMALVLVVFSAIFKRGSDSYQIIELSIMIGCGLLVYFVSSYFSGSLHILLQGKLFSKNRKNKVTI